MRSQQIVGVKKRQQQTPIDNASPFQTVYKLIQVNSVWNVINTVPFHLTIVVNGGILHFLDVAIQTMGSAYYYDTGKWKKIRYSTDARPLQLLRVQHLQYL